jgi:hypothetical protein
MGDYTADFNTDVSTAEASRINDRTRSAANAGMSNAQRTTSMLRGYFDPHIHDPRSHNPAYTGRLSRFGRWWQGYEKAYQTLLEGSENYRDDWNETFDESDPYLDTQEIRDEWGNYLDRIKGYYGSAQDNMAGAFGGYRDDWVDRDAYDLWGNLATGDDQAQNVQDWFSQSSMGQYLEDQANENFWRQAQLGGRTYNPQEVQEFISQNIVAPEAQQGFQNLERYASMQPELDWRVTGAQADLERWYADAVAQGDTIAQQQIADLMNQQNQQMWQSTMTRGMGDANLRYLIESQMPATRTMDYTNQRLAHMDARLMATLAGGNKQAMFNWLANVSMPNAYDSFLWESGMYKQAMENQQEALNAANAASVTGAGLGALGSAIGAI